MGALYKLWRFVKPYWLEILFSLLCLGVTVSAELFIPRLSQRAIDQGINQGDLKMVVNTALLMLGVTLLSAVFAMFNAITAVRVSQRFAYHVRQSLFDKIQSFSFGNLDHATTGELLVSLTSDLNQTQFATMMMMRMAIRGPLMIIGSLIMIFRTDPSMGWKIMILMVSIFGIMMFISPHLHKMFMGLQKRLDRLNTIMQENLSGVRVVKSFVRQDYEINRFGGANQDYTKQGIKAHRLMSALFPFIGFIMSLGTVLVLYVGGVQVVEGTLTTGAIVAFISYLGMTMFPLMMLSMLIGMLASAGASAERINRIMDTEIEIQDKPDAIEMPAIKGKVEFRNVSFAYRGSHGDTVLKNVSFEVEPGETVAILGATGSGKTSLVNLIPRLYEVTEGAILIDGIDIRDVTQNSLQKQIGIALQESILFSGTVAENIRYGRPNATDEEVRRAAEIAQADEFIRSFADGYEYYVGQRGANLSGGQKQRVSIARAVCTDPAILILDDSTSAVDVDTETKIQEEMEKVLHGRTSFIIAQRISTVLNADKIIVLDDGKVVSIGNHKELIQNCDIYRDIYDSQLGNGGVNHD